MVKREDTYAAALAVKRTGLEKRRAEHELKLKTAYEQLPRLAESTVRWVNRGRKSR